MPIGDWIKGPYAGQFRDEVLAADARTAALIDQRHLDARFEAHSRGREDNSYMLWSVWVLEKWLRKAGQGAS